MSIVLLEASIVVIGSDCNPTILNPDFLARRNIVPEDWGWKLAAPPITTPPFATVQYNTGVAITVEINKFQVIAGLTNGPMENLSTVMQIAQSYVQVLPHVRYTAVGNNFRGFVERDDPDAYVRQRFFNQGLWKNESHQVSAVGLKLGYALHNSRLTLSIDGAKASFEKEGQTRVADGVLIQGNYHRDVTQDQSEQQVAEHIGCFSTDKEDFLSVVPDVLALN